MTSPKSTILIVDDQPSARETLEALLFEPEYTLAFAADGLEALQQAAGLAPDLILLDVMMPGLDGYEVCRRLRADPDLAEVPVVMITALDDQESRLKGLEAGADDFISKPFNRLELRARVRTITRLNRYRRLLLERMYRREAEAEVSRRNGELTWLNRVITMVASTHDVPAILYIAAEAIAHILDVPRATAVLLSEDLAQFVLVVEYELPRLAAQPPESAGRPAGQSQEIPLTGLLSEYLSSVKGPLVVDGEQAHLPLTPVYNLMRELDLGTLLIAPILIGNRVAGTVEVKTRECRSFNTQQLNLAHSIGVAAGKAIESALLARDLERAGNGQRI